MLDFSRILAGPYCSLLLRDMGADVAKVEEPLEGDETRRWGPPFLDADEKISAYFASLNRGKRSVALDFRNPQHADTLRFLASRADVVLENFRPGTLDDVGLGYESLRGLNPRLVFCSISGFGTSGAYGSAPASEITIEALSGLMQITGSRDGEPVRFGIAMVDIATGLTAAAEILAALMVARATGQGRRIDASLYRTAVACMGTLITGYTITGKEPTRWGSHHPSICPYGGFPTLDGVLITGIMSDSRWQTFCDAMELEALARDDRFDTNDRRVRHRDEVESAIALRSGTRPTAYWVPRLRERGLLAAPVRGLGAALADPVVAELDSLVELEGFPGVVSPRLDTESARGARQSVPALGQHTQTVQVDWHVAPSGS